MYGSPVYHHQAQSSPINTGIIPSEQTENGKVATGVMDCPHAAPNSSCIKQPCMHLCFALRAFEGFVCFKVDATMHMNPLLVKNLGQPPFQY